MSTSLSSAIKDLLKDRSVFFVQVGANDGLHGDPIHDLIVENKHWRGIFVEPVRFVFERLKQNYGACERFIFENVAVGAETGESEFFYVSKDAKMSSLRDMPIWYDQLGSFDRQHIRKHFGRWIEPFIVSEIVKCVRLETLFQKHDVDRVDLLHIDVEGYDYKVLSQLDFTKHRPLVISYEHKHLPREEVRGAESLLIENKYIVKNYGDDTLAHLHCLARTSRQISS